MNLVFSSKRTNRDASSGIFSAGVPASSGTDFKSVLQRDSNRVMRKERPMKVWLAISASAVTALFVCVLFLRGQAPGEAPAPAAADQAKDKRTITTSGAA